MSPECKEDCEYCNPRNDDTDILINDKFLRDKHLDRLVKIKRTRKQMAWTALVSCIVAVLLLMFVVPESRIGVIGEVMTWFFFIMGSIVGSYIGFTSFDGGKLGSFTKIK